jgi:asparagine synthase (glutamine-hydrolysing)
VPGPARPLAAGDPLQRLAWLDWRGRLPESILVKVDRASMAAGLEVRSPLLDTGLVRLCARLPTPLKLAGGEPKGLLRRVLERQLPAPPAWGPKRGFGVPLGAWLRGPLREWAEDLLAPEALRRGGLLEVEAVRALWRQHLAGRRDRRFLLWNLLTLQAWQAAQRDRRPSEDEVPWNHRSSRRVREPMDAEAAHAPDTR